ncbi:MAG: TlpA family protein disulfide reductase [Opitutaceae bacterium]|nr:TlpA family protein disulfide reductase [Opitutaceae bacterium]
MTRFSLTLALTLLPPVFAAGPSPTPATPLADLETASPADRDWSHLMDFLKNKTSLPADWEQRSPSDQVRANEAMMQRAQDLELAFIDSHPTDPRRWEIVVILRRSLPRFVTEIPTGYDMHPDDGTLILDHAAFAKRLRRIATLEQALLSANDLPSSLSLAKYRPLFLARTVDDALTLARTQPGVAIDWASLATKVDAYARDFPGASEAEWLENTYLQLLESKRSDALRARLQQSAQSPNAKVRAMVAGRLRVENARDEPMELTFTALDGRKVDLAGLRGKVVLIDFWATWCGPCIAELPNVKAAYEKYHDRGFEVIGIALDAEVDREKLRQFIEREHLPWPQYFDGKKWKTALARDFSVSSIPTTFLLGPDGRLASTSARGKSLDLEISRLLNP